MSTTYDPTIRIEAPHSIFTTALEGGIGYWSECSEYRWSVDPTAELGALEEDWKGFHAVIWADEEGGDEQKAYRIDRTVILRGLQLATRKDVKYLSDAAHKMAGRFQFGDDGWDEYLDASSADEIVQLGLFGRVIFG